MYITSYEFKPGIAEIEDEPINPIGRTIFWTLMCLILFTGLWLFFGKADIVVTARAGSTTCKSYHIGKFFKSRVIPAMRDPSKQKRQIKK